MHCEIEGGCEGEGAGEHERCMNYVLSLSMAYTVRVHVNEKQLCVTYKFTKKVLTASDITAVTVVLRLRYMHFENFREESGMIEMAEKIGCIPENFGAPR